MSEITQSLRILARDYALKDPDTPLAEFTVYKAAKRIEELEEALNAALGWIDAVPSDTVLPAMPGFDRDWVDGLLKDASSPTGASNE